MRSVFLKCFSTEYIGNNTCHLFFGRPAVAEVQIPAEAIEGETGAYYTAQFPILSQVCTQTLSHKRVEYKVRLRQSALQQSGGKQAAIT